MGWQIQDYNPYGAAGNATLATAAKGHAVINTTALQLARLLKEVNSLPLSSFNAHLKFRVGHCQNCIYMLRRSHFLVHYLVFYSKRCVDKCFLVNSK